MINGFKWFVLMASLILMSSLQAARIAKDYPKVASTDQGTKGAVVALLDVPYENVRDYVKIVPNMKLYIHPKALETTQVDHIEVVDPNDPSNVSSHPVIFLKVKIVGSMTREAYLYYTITESADKIIFEWKNIEWQGNKGTFTTNKGRAIYSRQAGNKTQVQYVLLANANITVPAMVKRKLMKDNLVFFANKLEELVAGSMATNL